MDQALRPTSHFEELTSLVDKAVDAPTEEGQKKELDEETQALAYISRFKGWQVFKDRVKGLDEQLDQMVKNAIEANASNEEIGQRVVAVEVIKYATRQLIEWVEDARNAQDR